MLSTACVVMAVYLSARPAAAQDTGVGSDAVSPDSADAIRASLVRPPSTPPTDAVDVLAFPFRVAFFPLKLLGSAAAEGIGLLVEMLEPPEVSLLEILAREGFHPFYGSLGPRSSGALGLRFDRWSPLFVQGAVSLRGSQRHAVGIEFGDDLYRFETSYQFQRDAEPHFWGVGPDTRRRDLTDYRWDRQLVTGQTQVRLGPVGVAASAGFQDNRVARGFDDDVTDIQDIPEAEQPFGVNERLKYFTLALSGILDATRWTGHQLRGLSLDLAATGFLGTGDTDSDFYRIEAALNTYAPLNQRQSLALRGLGEINRGRGRGVPFTHLARLGDEHGSRAYKEDRFRDRDLLALMSEWRYEVWRELHNRGRVESFLFADAGAVDRRLSDISFDQLRWSYGFGFRIVWSSQLRGLAYLAFGADRTRFDLDFSWVY